MWPLLLLVFSSSFIFFVSSLLLSSLKPWRFLVFCFVVVVKGANTLYPWVGLRIFGPWSFSGLIVSLDTCRYIETWDRKHNRLVLWRSQVPAAL